MVGMERERLLSSAMARLQAAGVESPRLEAQLLLAQVMGVSRTAIVAGTYPALDSGQRGEYARLVGERERRVPLAYLRGTQEFYGLEFAVGPGVLIPRPETELLVEIALAKTSAGTIADVGTGSGCILTAILANADAIRGVGFDLSAVAVAIARSNAACNGVTARARFVRGDLLSGGGEERFDVVVSNPPYIPSAEIAALQPEVREQEPRLALDGGADGLTLYRRLTGQALRALHPGGWLAVEVGRGQAPDVAALFTATGLRDITVQQDLAGIERMVCGQKGTV